MILISLRWACSASISLGIWEDTDLSLLIIQIIAVSIPSLWAHRYTPAKFINSGWSPLFARVDWIKCFFTSAMTR
ncbi:hypothetical protein D1872_207580 [compost metagenome]